MKTTLVTDHRVKLISNIVNGIKAIKLYVWEETFLKRISQVREQEMKKILQIGIARSFCYAQTIYQREIGFLFFYITVVFIYKSYDPSLLTSFYVYTTMGLVNALFESFTIMMPFSMQGLVDIAITCKRLNNFLTLDILTKQTFAQISHEQEPMLHLSDVSAYWDEENRSANLCNIHLNLRKARLVAVTSLVLAALGELPITSGYIFRSKDVGYLPQAAWIFPGTIRDNVLCGNRYDQERYWQVLKVTTLETDCERMPKKDTTLVGDRGICLSGGQRARVGLARIAYAQSQIVFLDDPLAAVDARVAAAMFRDCIQNFMQDRMRILVTHQHHLLQQMDYVVVLENVHSKESLLPSNLSLQTNPMLKVETKLRNPQ
ncbi:hypothetical protein Ciccas_004175 [Cichlidogyrus casuarinus]|uniref:ABC transporter domain-containing protein n=1 Tax=Cichlidogyrus casuarinus TaxID=1844966 RepID=A0ABD2QCC9_9PLAT